MSHSSIELFTRFQLVPGTQKGQAFPPLLSVSYKDVFLTDLATQTVRVSQPSLYLFLPLTLSPSQHVDGATLESSAFLYCGSSSRGKAC
jgi:hypothetical protein